MSSNVLRSLREVVVFVTVGAASSVHSHVHGDSPGTLLRNQLPLSRAANRKLDCFDAIQAKAA